MRNFFEQYGFIILVATVVIILIAMASPIGSVTQHNIKGVANNFGSKTEVKVSGIDDTNPFVPKRKDSQKAEDSIEKIENKLTSKTVELGCQETQGFWVMLIKDETKLPASYNAKDFRNKRFYGADKNVIIDGKAITNGNWKDYKEEVEEALADVDFDFLEDILNARDDMDWISIQVYKSGTEAKLRYISGMAGDVSSVIDVGNKKTAIETYLENN